MAIRSILNTIPPASAERKIIDSKYRETIGWGNTVASVRWNHEISPSLFFNLTGYYTGYDYKITDRTYRHENNLITKKEVDDVTSFDFTSNIIDTGAKVDFDLIPNTAHYIRFGATRRSVIHSNPVSERNPATIRNFVVQPTTVAQNTTEVNGYIEDDMVLTPKLRVNAGVHLVSYMVPGKTYFGVQPRLSASYLLRDDFSVKASYSYMQQYLQTVSTAGLGMPIDLWVPVTADVKPQNSQQLSLSLVKTFPKT